MANPFGKVWRIEDKPQFIDAPLCCKHGFSFPFYRQFVTCNDYKFSCIAKTPNIARKRCILAICIQDREIIDDELREQGIEITPALRKEIKHARDRCGRLFQDTHWFENWFHLAFGTDMYPLYDLVDSFIDDDNRDMILAVQRDILCYQRIQQISLNFSDKVFFLKYSDRLKELHQSIILDINKAIPFFWDYDF